MQTDEERLLNEVRSVRRALSDLTDQEIRDASREVLRLYSPLLRPDEIDRILDNSLVDRPA